MRLLPTVALVAALALPLWAQEPTDTVGKGEFPGLQLLPPGSEIKGISLPRYENRRVTALIQASVMRVLNRRAVELGELRASLYSEDGAETKISTSGAVYDFTRERAVTVGEVEVQDPRFSAKGRGVVFSTATRRGILIGPVRTTLSASVLNPPAEAKAPAAPQQEKEEVQP